MGRTFYREQKHICGKSYDTAPYMEVDLYPVTEQQHRACLRAKKKEASSMAQMQYNHKKAKRYCVQLVATNFRTGDFSLTLTYNDRHLPDADDWAQVDRDWSNYIKRVYRWCDKNGVNRPKWVMASEYATRQEDGKVVGRHHHHVIIQRTEGLTREVLEDLWRDKKESMGMARCDRLEMDHGSCEALVKYINKNGRCKRSWRQSRGLEKPKTPKPNDSKWTRRKIELASTLFIDDAAYWERQYPGYTLNRVDTSVTDDGRRHTTVMLRRAECWHGSGKCNMNN